MITIYPNVAIGHYTVKLNEYSFSDICNVQFKMLAVPTYPGRQITSATSCGVIMVIGTQYAPIMRNIQFLPLAILKTLFISTLSISFKKHPTFIKRTDFTTIIN